VTGGTLARFLGQHADKPVAAQFGYTVQVTIHGASSGISRAVWVYLPPQYFQPAYAAVRFPVMELLHGFPGSPRDWVNVVGITTTLRQEIQAGRAKPVVLVMPDVNGGRGISLQCLNQPDGPRDATYLARDLPAAVAGLLRVQPPGPAWAVAGYSEGGFCAAELGLRFGQDYGYAGVLSGYFAPLANRLGSPPRPVSPYGHDRALKRLDTPAHLVTALPATRPVPQFWIGAGAGDRQDVASADYFAQLLQIRQSAVRGPAPPAPPVSVEFEDPGVQHEPLVQGGPQGPVNAILQVQLTAPPDDVREQVAVERRVLGQQLLQIKRILGGDELIEAYGTGWDLSPFPGSAGMIGIGPPVPDLLKDHLVQSS